MGLEVKFGLTELMKDIENAVNDEQTMLFAHQRFAQLIDPWTPKDEGLLSSSVEIYPDHIRYQGPYAHYVYEGQVYGPNYPIKEGGTVVGYFRNSWNGKKTPIIEGGNIVRWYSPPLGAGSKSPTGKAIDYTIEKHPLATAHWDKVAMQTQLEPLALEIKEFIKRRLGNG